MVESTAKVEEQFVGKPPIAVEEGGAEPIPAVPQIYAPQYGAVMDYLLQLDLPNKYKEEFERFKPMLTRTLALANIRREDIGRYLDYFDCIALWYKLGQPWMARKRMARMVSELMLTRSVDGFERIAQVTTRTEMKQTVLPGEEKVKKGWWIFGRGEQKKE